MLKPTEIIGKGYTMRKGHACKMITVIKNIVVSRTDLQTNITRLTEPGKVYYEKHPEELKQFKEEFQTTILGNDQNQTSLTL